MCLILTAWQSHPDYALVVAANRDEFYDRPADALSWWDDAPNILAGRDRAIVHGASGTWLGLSRHGHFAALTNYRAPSEKRTDARSRGELVRSFLLEEQSPEAHLHALGPRQGAYNGFNLLASDLQHLWWYSNRNAHGQPQRLEPGVYGLSNALLDTPWPKVRSRVAAFAETLAADTGRRGASHEPYLALLADPRKAPEESLPQTGVSLEWERVLSSAFIQSPRYGTRASTVLRVRHDGSFEMVERSFDASGCIGERVESGVLCRSSQLA
jgi:uncharacterized protein with NRDE domain